MSHMYKYPFGPPVIPMRPSAEIAVTLSEFPAPSRIVMQVLESMSQTATASRDSDIATCPFIAVAIDHASCSWQSKIFKHLPHAMSQNRIAPPSEPVIANFPSGEIPTESTGLSWLLKVRMQVPAKTSQILAVQSCDADIAMRPFGVMATACIS